MVPNLNSTIMKKLNKFNKTITVSVSVDDIATKLLAMFNKDEKHAPLVVNTIIGNALRSNEMISQVYNALNGYTNEIDFKINDEIVCDEKVYQFQDVGNADGTLEEKYSKMGICKIVDINLYRADKLKISFNKRTKEGKDNIQTTWVKHESCSKINVDAMV